MDPIEFAFGILALIAMGIGLMLCGEAFRAHVRLFLCIWLFLPGLSVLIRKWELLDVKSLRRLRTGFMVFVVFVSGYIFIGLNDVRNSIGEHHIEGYRHWTIETGENDNGETTYGQDWTADTASGRRVLSILQGVLLVLAMVCPVITWKALGSAISQRERQEEEYLAEIGQTEEKRL
jgi:hypothetical protein